jgi:hypothetical protein
MVDGAGAAKPTGVEIDWDRVGRLVKKVRTLFERKSNGRSTLDVVLAEYWALRFLVMVYEDDMPFVIDNEAEVLAFLKVAVSNRFDDFVEGSSSGV